MKELDEAVKSLYWSGEISDEAMELWNNLYTQQKETRK